VCRRNTDENGSGSGQVGSGGFGIIRIATSGSIIKVPFLEIKKRVNIQVFCDVTY
jgi:hypothetical protein